MLLRRHIYRYTYRLNIHIYKHTVASILKLWSALQGNVQTFIKIILNQVPAENEAPLPVHGYAALIALYGFRVSGYLLAHAFLAILSIIRYDFFQ